MEQQFRPAQSPTRWALAYIINESYLEFAIKSSVLDRSRLLKLHSDFIEFDDNELISKPPTRFSKNDLVGYRYGIKRIRGYRFYIGRTYCIDIKSVEGRGIKIRMVSLYGINKRHLESKFLAIRTALYKTYFEDNAKGLFVKFFNGDEIQFDKLALNSGGVLVKERNWLIPWSETGIKVYGTYFAIFSKTDPNNYIAFDYLSDWNTDILYVILKRILINKGFCEK